MSYASTCMISGLPIDAGDPVRYLLVTQNPYTEPPHNLTGLWFPRTFPVRAIYDGNGRVRALEQGPILRTWETGFKKDLVERGVGDNPYHDHAVSRSNFTHVLEYMGSARIRVRRVSSSATRDEPKRSPFGSGSESAPKIPDGVPTRKRIEKVLKTSGLAYTYLVDELPGGEVRIRATGFDHPIISLEEALPFLKDYASMLSAGMRSTTDGPEIRVCPLPTVDHIGVQKYIGRKRSRSLMVNHAMIREDVWQAFLDREIQVYDRQSGNTIYMPIEGVRAGINKIYKAYAQVWKKDGLERRVKAIDLEMDLSSKLFHTPGFAFMKSDVPFMVGLGTSWRMLLNQNPEIPSSVLATIAETAFIIEKMFEIRCYWKPSYSIGGSSGEWDHHSVAHQLFMNIAETQRKAKESRG